MVRPPMGLPEVRDDLAAVLRGRPRSLEAAQYGTAPLFGLDDLPVEVLEVTPTMAPFAGDHPHADGYGHYAVCRTLGLTRW